MMRYVWAMIWWLMVTVLLLVVAFAPEWALATAIVVGGFSATIALEGVISFMNGVEERLDAIEAEVRSGRRSSAYAENLLRENSSAVLDTKARFGVLRSDAEVVTRKNY